jgi:hypothetical protein
MFPALFLERNLMIGRGLRYGCRRSLVQGSSAAFNMAVEGRVVMDLCVCYCVYLLGFVFLMAIYRTPGNNNQVVASCFYSQFIIVWSKGIVYYISARVIFVFKIIHNRLRNLSLAACGLASRAELGCNIPELIALWLSFWKYVSHPFEVRLVCATRWTCRPIVRV